MLLISFMRAPLDQLKRSRALALKPSFNRTRPDSPSTPPTGLRAP
jgi:hypothetical protein